MRSYMILIKNANLRQLYNRCDPTFVPLIPLSFPPFEYKLKKSDGKVLIFDIIRKKYVVLTPEEWVRQHFIHFMIEKLHYPRSLIKIESGLIYNTLQKRCDITVYDRYAKPWLLAECKAPEQAINENTLRQASVYNLSIQAPHLVLTNGLKHVCCKVDHVHKTSAVSEGFPVYASHDDTTV